MKVAVTAANGFFKRIWGADEIELRNAAGLIGRFFSDMNTEFLKLHIICNRTTVDEFQCAKIQSILIFSHYRLVPPPTSFALAMVLALACPSIKNQQWSQFALSQIYIYMLN